MNKKKKTELKTSRTASVYPSWMNEIESRHGTLTDFVAHYYAIDEMLSSGDVKGAVNKLKEKRV